MKKIFVLPILLIVLSLVTHAQIDRSQPPAAGPAPAINIGEYQLYTLENGLRVIVVENHKLPRVSYNITVDFDPVLEGDKSGYVNFAGQLMNAGTQSMKKAEIDEAIDFIGASLSTSSDGMSGSCLSRHADKLLAVMSDVLLHPTFPEEELEKVRKQAISSLQSEKTSPDALSAKVTSVLNYGNRHPYGEFVTEASLSAVKREDLVRFYETYWRPNIAYLVIVGDITPEAAKKQAETYFGGWKRGEVPTHKYPVPAAPLAPRVALVPLPGAVQSTIDVTYPVVLRPGTDEAIHAGVLNNIFGGSGFQTRLMQNLREDKGFTYGAYSALSPDKLVSDFSARTNVRNEVTDSAIVELLFEMRRIVDELVPDTSLQTVKNIMAGSFARSLERPQTIANFALNIERYKLPKDFYANYLRKLNATTAKDVQAVAAKFIRPDNVNITVVGNKEIAAKLDRFAKTGKAELMQADGSKIIDLKPAPEGITAQVVLNNYIAAIGGQSALAKIKGYEQVGEMRAMGMNMPMKIKMKDQNKMLFTVSAQGMEVMKQVLNENQGAIFQMGQKMPLEGDDLNDLRMQADLIVESRYAQYGLTPVLLGIDKINEEEVYVVELRNNETVKSTDYFSTKTGLRVKTFSVKEAQGQVVTTETLYNEYLTLKKGIRFPSSVTQRAGGQTMEMVTTSVSLKPKFEPADFEIK